MAKPDWRFPKSVRLVIQFVPGHDASPASYVVLVYPGPTNSPFGSTRFYSREQLLRPVGCYPPTLPKCKGENDDFGHVWPRNFDTGAVYG